MWLRTHFTMRLRERHSDDVSGKYRAVIELANAMQLELEIQDLHPSMLRERELNDRVEKELKGGAISYAYSKAEPQMYSFKKGLKGWFKREKWWFAAIFITSTLCSTLWTNVLLAYDGMWFYFWLIGLLWGQFCAFWLGTTNGSRVLIISFWCVISGIVIGSCKEAFRDYI